MAKRVDRYSRLIAWLKVLLPLTALALLSTLFLLSRSVDPTTTIPFADTEVRERLRTQQITGPVFAGTTDAGDQISVSASVVRPGLTSSERPEADDLTAQINLSEGGQINLTAKSGELDTKGEIVIFRGSVVIENSEGYVIRTQQLRSSLSRIEADTLSSVSATSPLGDLQAGKMQLRSDPDSQSVQMVFTNGVKLIYRPKQTDR
jgi:lipopolysaccharide export system protein LptC